MACARGFARPALSQLLRILPGAPQHHLLPVLERHERRRDGVAICFFVRNGSRWSCSGRSRARHGGVGRGRNLTDMRATGDGRLGHDGCRVRPGARGTGLWQRVGDVVDRLSDALACRCDDGMAIIDPKSPVLAVGSADQEQQRQQENGEASSKTEHGRHGLTRSLRHRLRAPSRWFCVMLCCTWRPC